MEKASSHSPCCLSVGQHWRRRSQSLLQDTPGAAGRHQAPAKNALSCTPLCTEHLRTEPWLCQVADWHELSHSEGPGLMLCCSEGGLPGESSAGAMCETWQHGQPLRRGGKEACNHPAFLLSPRAGAVQLGPSVDIVSLSSLKYISAAKDREELLYCLNHKLTEETKHSTT